MTKVFLAAIGLIALITTGILVLFFDPFSNCPWAYRFEFETSCWVRDQKGNKQIIELFNAPQSALWLAIKEKNQITWLEHPEKTVASYNPHVPENEIKFTEVDGILEVNGVKFHARALPNRPSPSE